MSLWMVSRNTKIGCVLPKYSLVRIVEELEYIVPTMLMASKGYQRSVINVSNWAWSIESKAFFKSIYNKYIS